MSRWPMVPLSGIAKLVERPVTVEPGKSYRTIGVKWWGEGAYERETIDGSATAARTLSIVRADDLIINKIWVRHGSTAIAGKDVDGCAASGEFPTFALDRARVIPRWLHWLTKTRWFWDKCDRLSQGSSGKNRIRPERFVTIEAPLPPLPEQRRLVERIDALAGKIAGATHLREQAVRQRVTLFEAVLATMTSDPTRSRPLSEFISPGTAISYGVLVPGSDDPDGVLFVRVQDLHPSAPPSHPAKRIAASVDAQYARTRLRGDEVLVAVVGATIGKVGTVPSTWVGANIARAVCRIVPGPRIERDFLIAVLRSGPVQAFFRETTRTLAQPTLNVRQLAQTPIPDIPVSRQRTILAYLRACESRFQLVEAVQTETRKELHALLPAILDRAFRGEL